MQGIVFDIEADNLLEDATTIWCCVSKDLDSGEVRRSIPSTVKDHLTWLSKQDNVVGHNILGYDIPLIRKLYGIEFNVPDGVEDTFVMSSLFKPDIIGGHSLDAWGARLGFPKGIHTDFSKFTSEMLDYCERDVQLNARLYEYMQREYHSWDWSTALDIEYRMADIQAKQEVNGVGFDIDAANLLLARIESEIDELEGRLYGELPLRPVMYGTEVSKPFVKTGGYSKMVEDWYEV